MYDGDFARRWARSPGHPWAYWLFLGALLCFILLNLWWFRQLVAMIARKAGRAAAPGAAEIAAKAR